VIGRSSLNCGIAILLIETYLGFYDPDGQRAGDTFAETLVVEYRQGPMASSI